MSVEQVILTVTRADNQVVAILNGNVVYDRKTEGNPALSDQVSLTRLLAPGLNHLAIIGINWGGPASYRGTLQIDSSVVAWGQSQATPGNGMTWQTSFQIFN